MFAAPRALVHAGSLLASILFSPLVLPWIIAFYTWRYVYDAILAFIPGGLWPAAWPAGRTNIVAGLYTATITSAILAASMVGWEAAQCLWARAKSRRSRGYAYVELQAPGSQDERVSTARASPFTPSRAWKLRLGLHLLVVLGGVRLRTNYEQYADIRYRPDVIRANTHPRPHGYGTGEKIYIAAMFYNNENVVQHWTEEIVKLINYLGVDNVYVSVVESRSQDQTVPFLQAFDAKLKKMGVGRRILTGDTSVVRSDEGSKRIEFLAAVRNLAMEPLTTGTTRYDRVIFSNDVFVQAETVVELLRSKEGDWDMVCGVDMSFWGLYDTWVVRDAAGNFVSALWPFLQEEEGRKAIFKDEPGPVFTCWNGIIAFRADPFLPISLRYNSTLSPNPLPKRLPKSHPRYSLTPASPLLAPPLRFRQSEPDECVNSESFWLPYDLRRVFDMQKIYMNPRVIVAYDWRFYVWFKYVLRHWVLKSWMKTMEAGDHMNKKTRMVIGKPENVWRSDNFECHPWDG